MKPVPDVLGPDLRVLFCGINPSLVSAARGHHFARPGNRFWPALHLSGFTPRQLRPEEDGLLPSWGLGITNVVDRPTRAAADVTEQEFLAGAGALEGLVEAVQPRILAMVGLQGWRLGFRRPRARVGLQEDTVAGRPVWVLPNPSGLNAHYELPALIELFTALRRATAG